MNELNSSEVVVNGIEKSPANSTWTLRLASNHRAPHSGRPSTMHNQYGIPPSTSPTGVTPESKLLTRQLPT